MDIFYSIQFCDFFFKLPSDIINIIREVWKKQYKTIILQEYCNKIYVVEHILVVSKMYAKRIDEKYFMKIYGMVF